MDIEFESRVLEKEIDVFQISLHVLGEIGVALRVEVVLNLYLTVLEDFGVTLRENDFLFLGGLLGITDEVQGFLKVVHHLVDFRLVDGKFFLGESVVILFFLLCCCGKRNETQHQDDYFFHHGS